MTTPTESGGIGIFGTGTGPSIGVGGWSPEDPRSVCSSINGTMTGLLFAPAWVVLNVVPSALAANNLATSQSPGSAAITLSAGTGITASGGSFYIDGVPAANASSDISKLLTRCIRIVSGGNDSGITFAIVGLDEYGVTVHETLTGANASTATSVKTYKAITSITPSAGVASTVTVGTTDTIGFPLRADEWGDVLVNMNAAVITASTGFTAADATSPATATTGATRGKYTLQSASDGTKRLVVWQYPKSLTTVATLFGVTQF